MERSIFAIGLVLVSFLFFPLTIAQGFQTKDLQDSNVSVKAHLIKQDNISTSTIFEVKNIVFSFSNTNLNYTFEASSSGLATTSFLLSGTMKIETSQDPKVSDIAIARVNAGIDVVNIKKANGVTKYISSDFDKNEVGKTISIGDANWYHTKGELVVLDNGSATFTMEGQPGGVL